MTNNAFITTERLILRQWSDEDLEPFAELNKDPLVREFFFGLLTKEQSDEQVKIFSEYIKNKNYGFFAASLKSTGEFIGCIGLIDVLFQSDFNKDSPAVEIGWRLALNHWGKGYATEGAKAALQYGFENLNLNEIVALTTPKNLRSRHVMEKIGMQHNPIDDFDHPRVPKNHPLLRHVLYRISK